MQLLLRPAPGLGLVMLLAFNSALLAQTVESDLSAYVASPRRSETNRVRDAARHPLQTLQFFDVLTNQTVIEIWPGAAAWWTEILAPYLKQQGRYIAAIQNPVGLSEDYLKSNTRFQDLLSNDPIRFARVQVIYFPGILGSDGSADVVLSFRNLHNWITTGSAEAAFASFFRVLKPGGILGIEDHRARLDAPADEQLKSGYVPEAEAIRLAQLAGFRLLAQSEINANPKDTKDYPEGVWSLPPVYRLKDTNRELYRAIGESDRFTLKFVKP